MIGIQYTIENKAGASFVINDHTTDPENFIALQSYPQFDLDVKNTEINREGQHGIWDFFSYYGKRAITFQGVIIGESEEQVEAIKKNMQTVLGFPLQPTTANDGYVYLRWSDLDGGDWQIECKLVNLIQFSRPMRQQYRLDFSFSLKSPDPFIYSQELHSIAGFRGYERSGSTFPIALPTLLGISYKNLLTAVNDGAVDTHTIIRIYGEVDGAITNPRILNLTTGKSFFLDSTIADENGWIEIDSKNGTVVNQSGADLSGDIIGVSEFITLAAGTNELIYLSDEDPLITLYEPSAPWTVAFRDTKI